MFRLLSLNLLFIIPAVAMQEGIIKIKDESVISPKGLGKIALYHTDKGFSIEKDNEFYEIESVWLDPELRKLNSDQIKSFQKVGYFQVKKLENGGFKLTAHARGLGVVPF